ncbi:MAG TPA: carotenoid biosynthesis protein [Syntrophobacteraceae bacterium]|nr:carotenoid biosynthesis protein [Syntrophobacteraceae bacterium]
MVDFFRLLLGTIVLRPYVFAFLTLYAVAATSHIGWRRTLLFLPVGYGVAWLSEFSSIHWGIPYGDYFYIPNTLDQELWVFGVPFMDSLSYVFLSYCSYSMAVFILSPVLFTKNQAVVLETREIRRSSQTLVLGAFLFVLLDIIIDPITLKGDRWFLGQIYGYRETGLYFGIPMSNFGGWLLVGLAIIALLQSFDSFPSLEPKKASVLTSMPYVRLLGPLLYVCILLFNLSVTFWIGEYFLGVVGCIILFFPSLLILLFTLYKQANLTQAQIAQHGRDFPLAAIRCPALFSGNGKESAGISYQDPSR